MAITSVACYHMFLLMYDWVLRHDTKHACVIILTHDPKHISLQRDLCAKLYSLRCQPPTNTSPAQKENFKQMFQPQDTLDHPCDVTVVVEDGEEFRAHKDVLSEASPFFEKLLNSDMKESNEGVIRLEMFNESVMAATLEFIYTGSVQISTREIAEDLIVMADYLLLPSLKTPAEEVVMHKWNASNCISTYYFAVLYEYEELLSRSRQFILANFSALAKTEAFLNLSNTEVKMWISSDEINVSAEEDVFEIILAWINHDSSKRKKYFAELFREVRPVYVSRDFICRDIATSDFVTAHDECLDLVETALKLIDSKNFDEHSAPARKSPAIVACNAKHILCYFPREDKWCRLGDSLSHNRKQIASPAHGKLYSVVPSFFCERSQVSMPQLDCCDLFSNTWAPLLYNGERGLKQIVVRNGSEIYALVKQICPECWAPWSALCRGCYGRKSDVSLITRYIPELNFWQEITSFISGLRERICLVAKDDYIYFIGGGLRGYRDKYLSDVERYDLSQNTWDKVADMQEARMLPCGAAAHGRIFIGGGNKGLSETCEMYNERSNEWQFIGSLVTRGDILRSMVCCDGNLYVLGGCYGNNFEEATVQCYDPDENNWYEKTKMPFYQYEGTEIGFVSVCSVGICKNFLRHQPCNLAPHF